MPKYIYEGPVTSFGTCICNKWVAETVAPTPSKAKSNLTYRFKKENNRLPSTRIERPGEIKECM